MFKSLSFFLSTCILLSFLSCVSEQHDSNEPTKVPVQEIINDIDSHHILLFQSESKLEIWSQDQAGILRLTYQQKLSIVTNSLVGEYEQKEGNNLTFKLLKSFYKEKIKLKIKGYQSNTYPLSNSLSLKNQLDSEAKKALEFTKNKPIKLYLFPYDFRSNETINRSMVSRHYDAEMYAFLEKILLINYKNGE